MAVDFLRKKWTVYFEMNDLNKDGVMTLEDANIFSESFIKHHNIKGEQAQQLKVDFQALWNSLLLFGLEEVDIKTYLEMMEKDFTEDKVKMTEKFSRVTQDVVNLFDINNDGFLSEDEYIVACKCWGMEKMDEKQHVLATYPQIKPGYISTKTFGEAWAAFFTNDDVNKADREKSVMFELGMIDHM